MTILGLLIVCVVLALGVWVASRSPAPISYVVWAVIAIVVIVLLLQVTGLMSAGALNRRI